MPKARHAKKKFIDPKVDNVVTFTLVHRSQKDPLVTDETAPQHVLLQTSSKSDIKEKEREFGVFYDDDYDYMQHLKEKEDLFKDFTDMDEFLSIKRGSNVGEGGDLSEDNGEGNSRQNNIQLPSSVFASNVEEDVGVLNRAAPQSGPLLDWDPDIVETLDDDFKHERVFTLQDEGEQGSEDEFDDDFLAKANGECEDGDGDDEDCDEKDFDSDFGGAGDEEDMFAGEEVRSKFTEYSMSSSVVPRSENLRTLDDKFDKFFDEYLEENIGGLDYDDIEGYKAATPETMKHILDEYRKQRAAERQAPDFKMSAIPEEYKYISDNDDNDDGGVDATIERVALDVGRKEEKWDCESIISTYSNMYNHPKLIEEPSIKRKVAPITISGKTGMPKDILGKGLTASALKELDLANGHGDDEREFETETLASRVSQLSIRPQHETLEEKRERKAAVKDLRRERRVEKKVNKVAFREEQARQVKAASSNRGNAKGVTKIT